MEELKRCVNCGNHLLKGSCISCDTKNTRGKDELPSQPVEVITDMDRYCLGTTRQNNKRTTYSSGKFDIGSVEVLNAVLGQVFIVKRKNGEQESWGTILSVSPF